MEQRKDLSDISWFLDDSLEMSDLDWDAFFIQRAQMASKALRERPTLRLKTSFIKKYINKQRYGR